jgi:hypothetical protein
MVHVLTNVPKIMPDAIPRLLYHGTNLGEAIRARGMRASKANAAGRGIYGFAWFFAAEEDALRYCLARSEDGPDGWADPEVLVYRYTGALPLLDLRGLEKEDIDGLGGAIHDAVTEAAGLGGVLIHSTTGRGIDEWGFVVSGNLRYVEARCPSKAWFALKEEEAREHERYISELDERRRQEKALEEELLAAFVKRAKS